MFPSLIDSIILHVWLFMIISHASVIMNYFINEYMYVCMYAYAYIVHVHTSFFVSLIQMLNPCSAQKAFDDKYVSPE